VRVACVLVVVEEHALALLLPPLRRRDLGRALLDLARQRERGASHLGERPARLDPRPHVRAARSAGLRPADEVDLVEHLLGDARDLDDLRPRHAGHRIEIDAELVRTIHVLAAHRVRVEIDAAEVDDVDERRAVVDADLVGVATGRKSKRRDVEPRRALVRSALLIERLGPRRR